MSKKLQIEDFVELGVIIKESLVLHNVDSKQHYSLISDILFHCAHMIDDKTGSHHHERVDGLIDEHIEKFVDGFKKDRFVSSVRITLGVGKKHITEVRESNFEQKESIKELVEKVLNISKEGKSFEEVTERRKGLISIGFSDLEYPEESDWVEVPFNREDSGMYDYSVKGICQLIEDNSRAGYNKLQQ